MEFCAARWPADPSCPPMDHGRIWLFFSEPGSTLVDAKGRLGACIVCIRNCLGLTEPPAPDQGHRGC